MKISDMLVTAQIAPPSFAELLINLLIPLKERTPLPAVRTAPPLITVELGVKLLVPMTTQ